MKLIRVHEIRKRVAQTLILKELCYFFLLEKDLSLSRVFSAHHPWKYEYYGNGMMAKVIRPDLTEVTFKYDTLGRRIEKCSEGKTSHFVWDGNTILHEYFSQDNSVENASQTDIDMADNLVTWVFNDGFVPSAKTRMRVITVLLVII